MPYIETIPPDRSEGDLKNVYADVLERRGAIANVHQIHALHPRTLKAHMDLYLTILFGPSQLSRQERETIAVAVSRANGCEYCVEHHGDALGRYQRNTQALDELKVGGFPSALTSREKALVEFATKLTREPQRSDGSDVERLRRAGLVDEEILMATLTASYFNFVNRLVLGLGVELERAPSAYKY